MPKKGVESYLVNIFIYVNYKFQFSGIKQHL